MKSNSQQKYLNKDMICFPRPLPYFNVGSSQWERTLASELRDKFIPAVR